MRKLTAVLCVVALVLVMAVPAFANPSVSSTVTALTPGVSVAPIDTGDIADAKVKSAIEGVNGEGYLTPDDVVVMLKGEDAPERADVKGYAFSSQFNLISADSFPMDVQFAGTDENTKIMLVDPADAETLTIIPASADGTFAFDFGGAFALIDPAN